jgi:hypothetical protein
MTLASWWRIYKQRWPEQSGELPPIGCKPSSSIIVFECQKTALRDEWAQQHARLILRTAGYRHWRLAPV